MNYNSLEISEIESFIREYINYLNDNVNSAFNDYKALEELELYSNGMKSLKTKVNNLVSINNKLINILETHDSNMNQLEKKQLELIGNNIKDYTESLIYSGEKVAIDKISLNNKECDGKTLLNSFIYEVIPNFSYEQKITLLKNILNDEENLISILTDTDEAEVLIYQLKEELNEKYNIYLSKLSNEEEKELQKSFFETICDNDTNIFDEVNGNSFLSGLKYYKQIAERNGISTSDLIFDKDKENLFVETTKDIYDSTNVDLLNDAELENFKSYIDKVAQDNNVTSTELLNDNKYANIIKGGIM